MIAGPEAVVAARDLGCPRWQLRNYHASTGLTVVAGGTILPYQDVALLVCAETSHLSTGGDDEAHCPWLERIGQAYVIHLPGLQVKCREVWLLPVASLRQGKRPAWRAALAKLFGRDGG